MGKTLNELAADLKAFLIQIQSDAHNKVNVRPERYNNLKMSMKIAQNPTPHVIINLSMSEAEFNLKSGEKVNGGLGADERYVLRWFEKGSNLQALMECWSDREKSRGKASGDYD